MKKIAVIIGLALSLVAVTTSAKPIPEDQKTFDTVLTTPTKSKDEIYLSTKIWLAETFKSSKAVIEVDSKEDGLLIGNGIIRYPCSGFKCFGKEGWNVPFTMKIEIKDEKFRVTFSNIKLYIPGQAGVYPTSENPISQQSDLDKIKPALLELASQLQQTVTSGKQNTDW